MGRSAGQPARVAGADRPSGGAKVPRPVLEAVRPAVPRAASAPLAPRPASTPPAAPISSVNTRAQKPAKPASIPVKAAPAPVASAPVASAPVASAPVASAPVAEVLPPALVPMSAPAAAAAVAALPRAGGRNDGTVREILPPWHVLQEKLQKGNAPLPPDHANEVVNRAAQEALAAQEAANATWGARRGSEDSIDIPPSSGVRMSEPGHDLRATPVPGAPATATAPTASTSAAQRLGELVDAPLSFKVYTLAELERRSEAPASVRMSRASFDNTASRTALYWTRVGAAFLVFARASVAWLRTKTDRPSIKVALRKPFDDLGDELQVAVEAIDWKKLGVTTGIVVGATLTLLFAVLTAAELTDDLKSPGSGSHLASTESGMAGRTALDKHGVKPATNMAAMGVQPVDIPAPVVIAPPATTTIGDIDTPDEAPAAPAAKKPAAKKPAPKKATSKLTLRSAPF